MSDHLEALHESGVTPVAVSFSDPSYLSVYLQKNPLPFLLVSDEQKVAYHAMGLEKTTYARIMHPRVIAGYLALMFRGWALWKPRKGDDLLQLGGDFLIDQDRKLHYSHRCANPTDRPKVADILAQIRKTTS